MISRLRTAIVAVTLAGTLAITGCQSSNTSAASKGPSPSTSTSSAPTTTSTSATATANTSFAPTTTGDSPAIALVKRGVLADYNTTTVGLESGAFRPSQSPPSAVLTGFRCVL